MSVISNAQAALDSLTLTQNEVADCREIPGRDGDFSPASDLPIASNLLTHLVNDPRIRGQLFRHQANGIRSILDGANTVVTTPTSSGKTLIFTVPIIQSLISDPQSRALLIYPQKSLANDQLGRLRETLQPFIGSEDPRLFVCRYDGATPQEQRPMIRMASRIVLTNPDMLHLGILQYHTKWETFFRHLKYVVIDEAHAYRGIFGSSVAYILRRLRAICDRYGSSPKFIAASATIDAPASHLRNLTGLDFVEVGLDQDGSIQGDKRIWTLRGSGNHFSLGRKLTLALIEQGLSCLTFCPSRKSAESLLDDLPDAVRSDGRVRVYRAGLSSAEREKIEQDLSSGLARAVFSTSALELGIDIGRLDAVVCVGLPNTMMSFWQRVGRVGRGGKQGAIFFVTADSPYDSYHADNPNVLFARRTENLAVNLENRRLVIHHLACAVDEAGDDKALKSEILGPAAQQALELYQNNKLTGHDIFFSDEKHSKTPVRSSGAATYKLVVDNDVVGEIDQWHLMREAYPHAVYLHGGLRFRVRDIRRSSREVRLQVERNYGVVTKSQLHKTIKTRSVRRRASFGELVVSESDLLVTERLVGVVEQLRDGTTVRRYDGDQGLSPHHLPTEGISLEISPLLVQELAKDVPPQGKIDRVLEAIGRMMGSMFPVVAGPCDQMDFDTFADSRSGSQLLYLYDNVYDGIGLTVLCFGRIPEILELVMERIQSCKCEDSSGCFSCIRDPDEDFWNDKDVMCVIIGRLQAILRDNEPRIENFAVDKFADDGLSKSKECLKCSRSDISIDAKFCHHCGNRFE